MKEHKSNMNMVARFAYIFATIVTIFAQMGAAVPAMITEAGTWNPSTIKITSDESEAVAGQKIHMRLSSTASYFSLDALHWFTMRWNSSAIKFDEAATKAQSGYSSAFDFITETASNGDQEVEVHPKIAEELPWPMELVFDVSDDVTDSGVNFVLWDYNTNETNVGMSLKGVTKEELTNPTDTTGTTDTTDPTDPAKLTADDLALHQLNPSPYEQYSDIQLMFNANLDNYPTKYRDVQFQVNETVDGSSTNANATFDPDATRKLAEKHGFTTSDPVTSEDHTVYRFADGQNDYNIWVFGDNTIRIEWPKGTKGTKGGYLVMKANKPSTKVTLTPEFIGSSYADDTPVDLMAGTAANFAIKAAPGIDGSDLRLDAHSVANDTNGTSTYRMSTFPLFYVKETADDGTQLYSFVYNSNSTGQNGSPTHSLETLRQAILAGNPYTSITGGAESTTNTQPAFFENFHAIGSNGYALAGSEKNYEIDKTYTLIPYNPLTTGSDRFKRIDTTYASHNYYMPDGVPTFSVNSTGNITLKSTGDGNAMKGQWTATGKTINAALYKVKKLKVVDQNGDPVTDAKLTLKNADGESAFMQASTASDGTGEFLPNDYADANKGPFYYADGAQAFDKLTLPSGYSQDVAFSKMTLSKTDDTLSLSSDKKNAEITDNGQTLTLKVHKYDSKDTDITINKVAKVDTKKNLGGATLHVEEVDGASDAVATKDVKTQDSDGLATLTVDATSATTERIFHVTETHAPDGYLIANKNGYYATWIKGSGFTAVGDTQDATGAASADGLATVKDGKLVIQDPDAYSAGGVDSKMRIQYVDSAEYLKPGTGTKISGAQLPVLKENQIFDGTGLAGFSGLGGVVYNPDTDPNTLRKADTGIASGTLQNDGTMYTSLEKSGTDGIGIVQGLWSQTGLVYGWEGLDKNTNGWILSNAIVSGTIPTSPAIQYQLISPAQRQRAVGNPASGYYNLGSTLILSTDGKILTIGNASGAAKYHDGKDRDNSISKTNNTDTAQVELYKVKHVRVVDTAGNKVPNAVVKFSDMTGMTGSDGSDGELLPNDINGQPTTKGDNFVFPSADQKLISVTDAANKALIGGDGSTLDSKNGFSFAMGYNGTDQLRAVSNGANVSFQDSNQIVQVTVKAPTTIKIHKQDFVHPDTAVAGATFKVWADGDEANAVTTPSATDDNGDTSVTLANSSANDTYHIQEVKAPEGYKLDQTDYTFTWTAKAGVSAVKDTTSHVMASGGVLHFADLKTGGGGVGDNGTNGGTLTIKKVDLGDAKATVPDGATFKLKQTMGGSVSDTQTTKSGTVSFNVGDATTTDKVFKITETDAPKGYVKASKSYLLRIQNDGTMTLAPEGTLATDITADHTDDNVIKFASSSDHTLIFGDNKDTNNNGGLFSLKKIDSSNAVLDGLDGATFNLEEADDGTNNPDRISKTATTADGIISFDLGNATNVTRSFTLTERTAPVGYVWNTQAYAVTISPTGIVKVGVGKVSGSPTMSTTQTSDKVVTVNGKGIMFADDPVTTQKNGGELTIKKVDQNDRTVGLEGTVFGPSEEVNGYQYLLGSDEYNGVTTDAQGDITLQLGQPTNTTRKILVREGIVPAGYQLNGSSYWLLLSPDGTINVAKTDNTTGKMTTPATSTPDGVFQVDTNNKVTFGNTLTPVTSTFTIKKTAMSDRKTAITKNLNGASFSASEVASGTEKSLGNFELQASGSTSAITTSKSSMRLRLVKIQETKAPTGYALTTKPYYVTLSALDGVVGVSAEAKTSTDRKSADGVVQIDDKNTVNFGDDVKKNSFSIKKTDASDPTKGVSGTATFEIHRLDNTTRKPTSDSYTVTTKDGDVTATDLTDGYFSITETSAPSGYDKESNPFYFKWSADQGVTALAGIGNETTNYKATKLNGAKGQQALSIDNGVLNFSDIKQAVGENTVTIKKLIAGTTTPLAGATFKLTDLGNGFNAGATLGSKTTPLQATTGADGTQQFSVEPTPSGQMGRVFEVEETQAPDGYNVSVPYYIMWDATNGVTKVVNTSGKDAAGAKATTKAADGLATVTAKAGTTPGYLNVFDVPKAPKAVVKLKKINVQQQALAGAKMAITETTSTGGAYSATDKMPQARVTSGSDGMFQFNPTATVSGSTHYFRVTEEIAPEGYAKGTDTLIVYKVGTGVVGVKTLNNDTVSNMAGPLAVTNQDHVITYTDEPLHYTLQVRSQAGDTDNLHAVLRKPGLPVSVKLTDVDNSGITYNVIADAATSDININTQQLAQALGYTTVPTSGQIKFKLSVDLTSAGSYTVPVPRTVIFKWGANGGFYIDPDSNDGMVTDINTAGKDAGNPMTAGDLRLMLRRDTLIAQPTAADASGNKANIANASFILTYKTAAGAVLGTQTVTTNAKGVGVIQEPSTFVSGNVTLKSSMIVTVTQDTAAKGYEKFASDMGIMTYNSETGFQMLGAVNKPFTAQYDPTTGVTDSQLNAGISFLDSESGISTQTYNFGGSQMIIPLTPIISRLTLDSAPQVMNFGHAQVLSGAQELHLLPKSTAEHEDTKSQLADFDLSKLNDPDATSTLTDDTVNAYGDFLNAQVTQVGPYTSGWQLKVAMSTLTSEDGSDAIGDSSVTMGTPQVTRTGDSNAQDDQSDLNMGLDQNVAMDGATPVKGSTQITDYTDPKSVVNTGTNSEAGVYHIAWDVKGVKMNLPAMVGKLNTNYQSSMAWALTWAP